jgi:hypothetical protein
MCWKRFHLRVQTILSLIYAKKVRSNQFHLGGSFKPLYVVGSDYLAESPSGVVAFDEIKKFRRAQADAWPCANVATFLFILPRIFSLLGG